jgi:hypothetical protein
MPNTDFPEKPSGSPGTERHCWIFDKSEIATFLISFALLGLVLLPILIADRYHLEDWRRLLDGTFGWIGEGRPLTELLMRVLNLGNPLMDLSPLPQVAAIALLSYNAVLISRKFSIKPPLLAALAALPIGGSPFFLANLSFRFDSLGMALSMLLALMPIVSTEKVSVKAWFIGALCIFASLGFYQTGINAFFVFLILELGLLQLDYTSLKRLLKIILFRVAQFTAGFLSYLILARTMVTGSYNQQHFAFVTKLSEIGIVAYNWKTAWHFIYDSFPGSQREILRMTILLGVVILIGIGLLYLRFLIRSDHNRIIVVLVLIAVLLLPLIWIAGSLGPVLFPVKAIITLPRIHMGIGPLLSSSFVLICVTLSRYGLGTKWLCIALAIPAYLMIMFAFVFGNALKEQKHYEDRIGAKLCDDVEQITSTQPVDHIIMNGIVSYAPTVRQAMRRYRLLRSLVSIDFRTDRNDGDYIHNKLRYYGLNTPPENSDESRSAILSKTENAVPLRTTDYYRLYAIDHYLIIDFNAKPPR